MGWPGKVARFETVDADNQSEGQKNASNQTKACVLRRVPRHVGACDKRQNKEDMLAAAGFTLVPANTPQRQASLSALPPHKFVHQARTTP